jgi:rubrerythrin
MPQLTEPTKVLVPAKTKPLKEINLGKGITEYVCQKCTKWFLVYTKEQEPPEYCPYCGDSEFVEEI